MNTLRVEKKMDNLLETFTNIVKDLQDKFPDKSLDKDRIRIRMKNIKKNWTKCYDIFKGGLSGFGWDPILQNWTADDMFGSN